MGAGSSTEQRSPEQPPEGSDAPAEPELISGGPSAEAAPDTSEDPTIIAADPSTKVRASAATCPGEAGTEGSLRFPPGRTSQSVQPFCKLTARTPLARLCRVFRAVAGPEQQRARLGTCIFVVGL